MTFIKFDGHVHTLAFCAMHKHHDMIGVPISPYKLAKSVQRVIDDRVSFVITDHETTDAYKALQANEYRGKRIVQEGVIQDMGSVLKLGDSGHIVCGQEITCSLDGLISRPAHVLAWGIDETIPHSLSLNETIYAIKEAGGLAVIPHLHNPALGIGEKNLERIADKIYGIELSLGIPIESWHKRVLELANEYMLRVFVGTDAHLPEGIASQGYSQIPSHIFNKRTGKEIVDGLRYLQISPDIVRTPDVGKLAIQRVRKFTDIWRYALTEAFH